MDGFFDRQKAFLRMVTQNSSSDDFTRRVGGLVENAKRNTQWRQQFMEWDREMACMRAKGREEGAQQKAVETARNALAMNLTAGQTGLPRSLQSSSKTKNSSRSMPE